MPSLIRLYISRVIYVNIKTLFSFKLIRVNYYLFIFISYNLTSFGKLYFKTNAGKTLDLPFSKTVFPKVDIENHQIELNLPDELKEVAE